MSDKRIYEIKINGALYPVVDRLSSGPGTPVHTYELGRGRWVAQIAGEWKLHQPGCWPQRVTVEVIPNTGRMSK